MLFAAVDMDDTARSAWGQEAGYEQLPDAAAGRGGRRRSLGSEPAAAELNATAYVGTVHDIRLYNDGYALSFEVGDQISRR